MSKNVLDHHLEGERARLTLMSRPFDPMHRRHVEALGVEPVAFDLVTAQAILHHVADPG
jgi:hypothetical protein